MAAVLTILISAVVSLGRLFCIFCNPVLSIVIIMIIALPSNWKQMNSVKQKVLKIDRIYVSTTIYINDIIKQKENDMTQELLPHTYGQLLQDLKSEISSARIRAHLAVNKEMILLYWRIGKKILERQSAEGRGAKVIENISKDLKKEFPEMKGLSYQNISYMRQFVLEYKANEEFLQQAVGEIPWGHNIMIFSKIQDVSQRIWYAKKTLEYGWSRNVLSLQIETDLYARDGKSHNNFDQTLPSTQSDLVKSIIKDPYHLEFLNIKGKILEQDLEGRLIDHIQNFLLELGQGFAFVGRQ
ncbi:MAG: PDDEXK nuclease domain-containing protein [Rickettsiaceae bacterium]|nr:PDDEXK nuclease domain-containing protein [Rickettsiaceae bacterium]